MESKVIEVLRTLFPYLLGKRLWQLGVRGKVKSFKGFYQAILSLTSAAYAVFLVIKVLVWTWRG